MAEAIPVAVAAKSLDELVERVAREHDHVLLTGGKGSAVLIGVEDLETLEILSDPELVDDIRQGLKEIAAGDTDPLEEVYPNAVSDPTDQAS